jgi:DMSO/TMAO reductase YedYZ molybdopterin-dependent catalytic subunit
VSGDEPITRRRALAAGLASAGALLLAGCGDDGPPTYGNLLRAGDLLTYRAHRALLSGRALAREYDRRAVSSFPAIGTTNPADPGRPSYSERWARLQRGAFADYRLRVEGLVARPGSYALDDLKRLPGRTQITKHVCEEGWTAIAEWTGVSLRRVLAAAGMLPSARYVKFYTFDGWADSLDMRDALHPQTLLAYGMNGRDLRVPHGAPLRLRVETQLGYKSLKYLDRVVVTDRFDDMGPTGSLQTGWAWYAGI